MTRAQHWCRADWKRRHAEALALARDGHRAIMQPPAVRVVMPHEQELAR